ncbi:MAG: AAA family ATPase [Oscillospiraceae bacterium]|nr:AAA family ATPase [Oscillospiraceae bacterium]
MKLTMKNIGVIRDAEIELDGITVLAGLNGTGKSTTSKALYGVIAPYVNLSEEIADERRKSVQRIIQDFLKQSYLTQSAEKSGFYPTELEFIHVLVQTSSEIVKHPAALPEQYEDWVRLFPKYLKDGDTAIESEVFPKFLEKLRNAVNRSNAEYVQFLADKTMKSVFAGQINTIGSLAPGEIALTIGQDKRIAWTKIVQNRVAEYTDNEIAETPPIYLDTRHVLDGLNESERKAPYTDELYEFLKEPISEPTFEEYKSRERILELIASVIHGKLIRSDFGEFVFKDDRFSEPISLRNVASGNKTFAVLQRLIENGALREGSMLIIDEPESNQHPQWQLKLAETLALLHKELGVRIFLNTHSTYFLRAIEVYAKRHELSDHCHYYQTQPIDDAENLFQIRNVDGNTKLIYRDFYMPFEEL